MTTPPTVSTDSPHAPLSGPTETRAFEDTSDGRSSVIDAQEFRRLGRQLIDRIAEEMERRPSRPLTCHSLPQALSDSLRDSAVPEQPRAPAEALGDAVELMYDYSLFTSHPRFLGYVCPAADPMGMLADTLTASVNPNAASAMMTPIGHALEKTVLRWLAQILGFEGETGGILVSGGNVANLMGILVARDSRAAWPVREFGFDHPQARPLRVYATEEAHGGIRKAIEVAGLGGRALRLVAADEACRMRVDALAEAIREDKAAGHQPICVVASIGTVGTGAIDPLAEIVELARREGLSVHVDGSYGAAMALAPNPPPEMRAVPQVDSISWDPHKWLRVPMEAGCILLRDPEALRRTFGNRPSYYTFGDYAETTHYYEQGLQNSRFLRAVKVWLSLQQHGTQGHGRLIARDLELTRRFHEAIKDYPRLEQKDHNLCVSTFRYLPDDAAATNGGVERINRINAEILNRTQMAGDYYLSNATVQGEFFLRACFVNYNTQESDIDRILSDVVATGNAIAAETDD